MAAAPQGQAEARAWIDYFRDLGIYDFYRSGELESSQPTSASDAVESAASASVVDSVAADSQSIPPPSLEPVSVEAVREQNIPRPIPLDQRLPLPGERVPVPARPHALEAIRADIGDCTRCPLAYAGRRNIVFGNGPAAARLMFVGEGPGADEDEQGIPFVGKSGQLLNNMIAAMGLARDQVYIANVVKCRPPANRAPEPVEANTCTQFLAAQMDVVAPEVVVALGATAATYLLGVRQSLASLRGRWHRVRGAQCLVTFHPAYLLRDPRQKVEAWKDLQQVMAHLGLQPPARPFSLRV